MHSKVLTFLCANLLFIGSCGGRSTFRTTAKSPSAPPVAEPTVIPPVQVTGSYLTSVLNLPDGTVSKDTTITVVETEYKTKTDGKGEFKIPVSKIPQTEPTLIIALPNKEVIAQWNIPSDIDQLIIAARAASDEIRELSRKLSILVTEDILNASSSQKQKLTTFSLPAQASSTSVPIGIWGEPQFQMPAPGQIQLLWRGNLAQTGVVTIITGKNSADISAWDGDPLSVPTSALQFSSFDQCNSTTLSSASTGPFTSNTAAKCGFDLVQKPFEIGTHYFFKISLKSTNGLLISTVFAAPPADKSPKTFKVPGKFSMTIPTATASITFKIWGAGGAGQGENNDTCSPGLKSGGGGGFIKGTIAVVPGNVITIRVGDGNYGGPPGLAGFGAGMGGESTSLFYENELIAMAGGGGGAGQSASGGGGGGNGPGRAGKTSATGAFAGGAGGTLSTGCKNTIWSTNESNGCEGGGSIINRGNRGGGGGAGFYGGFGGTGGETDCTGSGGGGGSGYLHPNVTNILSLTGNDGSPTGAAAVNVDDPHYASGTGGSGQSGSVTVIFN